MRIIIVAFEIYELSASNAAAADRLDLWIFFLCTLKLNATIITESLRNVWMEIWTQ